MATLDTARPPSAPTGKITPLMQQYWDVKSVHPDKIILFRMGDFFEMFHRDAEIAAPVLGIALTSRNKKSQDETPMCGVPHHSVTPSINKLLAAGFKVAICDQLEDPKFAKGLVKRGVTRVLTPGMVFDADTLDASVSHFLVSWDFSNSDSSDGLGGERGSVAFFDASTGEGFYFDGVDRARRNELIRSLRAVEAVYDGADFTDADRIELSSITLSEHRSLDWVSTDGERVGDTGVANLRREFEKQPVSVRRLMSYALSRFAKDAAIQWASTLTPFEKRTLQGRMALSDSTVRHLEVFQTYKGERVGSLFHSVDRTQTSGGARLLKSWLSFPLMEEVSILERQACVELWIQNEDLRKKVRESLKRVGDLPRRLGKVSQPSRGPRDLRSLYESCKAALEAWKLAQSVKGAVPEIGGNLKTEATLRQWELTAEEVSNEIDRVLVEEPPHLVRTGGAIRLGANAQLDEWIEISTNSNQLILDLELREKERTGIGSLKIRYNNVFGYSIEVTNVHKDKVPLDRYSRKQTLANAERFTTPELIEIEQKVLSAEEKRLRLEEEEFSKLSNFVISRTSELLGFARVVSELDVVTSLADLARSERFVRPRFHRENSIQIKGSRHPVIEMLLPTPFIANDIHLGPGGCLLLTGPNMAGKSTLMRQVAITSLLAQVGCFVPAKEALLPIVDRISTRIGASDFLTEGLSTFMVEMKETAELLESATERSLLVLDEIGRGTSTFDGLSLAQAILEYILREKRCLTFFATHYHELTSLSQSFPRLQNAHMAIHEKDGVISFLHRLLNGPAKQSYGIHVARLAGLPRAVTERASLILREVEASLNREVALSPVTMQLSLLDQRASESVVENRIEPDPKVERIINELKTIAIDSTTPLQALNKVAKWTNDLRESNSN